MTNAQASDVAVCIVSHNSRTDLEVCLTRLHEAIPDKLSVQVTVVDNTGSDGSSDYVRQNWPAVRIMTNSQIRGFAANINQAAAGQAARYFLVMNPDVGLLPGALEAMVAYMDDHPEVGVCGPKTLYPDGSLQATCRQFPHWVTILWRWLKLDRLAQPEFYRHFMMSDWDHATAQAVDWVMGSCMLIRREAFEALNGFDEGFFLYYEDVDFCRRLWQAGFSVHYVPEAVVIHTYQRHSAQGLFNHLTRVHMASILRYSRKHGLGFGQVAAHSSANLIVLLMLGDVLITQLALQIGRYARLLFPILGAFPYPHPSPLNPIIYAVVPVIWLTIFALVGVYRPEHLKRLTRDSGRLLLGVALSGMALAGSLYALFLYEVYIPRLLLVYFLAFDAVLLIAERAVLHALLGRDGLLHRPRALIVGSEPVGQNLARWINNDRQAEVDLICSLSWQENGNSAPVAAKIARTVQQLHIETVFLTPPLPDRRVVADVVKALQRQPVDIKIVPDFLDLALHRAQIEPLYGVSVISLRSSAIQGARRISKRVFDLLIAVPAMMVLLPVLGLVAIAVRLDSPGPIFFRQRRVGENGRLFWMYKFRSMRPDAEKHFADVAAAVQNGSATYKTAHDQRVTRVGRFLRRWSIDELPQLWNVVKGEMSLVGPRPEMDFVVEQYEDWQYKRLAVPPGITGWWQITSRRQDPRHIDAEEDLFYIEHFSVWLDVKIIIKTARVVLLGQGSF